MKVITENLVIMGKSFVLIEDEQDVSIHGLTVSKHFFGTIPHSALDSNGRMKRAMNGAEMCNGIDAKSAIHLREMEIKAENWKMEHPNYTMDEFIRYLWQSVE